LLIDGIEDIEVNIRIDSAVVMRGSETGRIDHIRGNFDPRKVVYLRP